MIVNFQRLYVIVLHPDNFFEDSGEIIPGKIKLQFRIKINISYESGSSRLTASGIVVECGWHVDLRIY